MADNTENKSLLQAVLGVIATRLELFSLELSDEKQHLSQIFALTVVFSVFLILFFITALALFLFLLWESPFRFWYIGACIIVFGLIAASSFLCLRRKIFNQIPFKMSVQELKTDIDTLNKR